MKDILLVIKTVLILAAVGAALLGGIFLLAGWEEGAVQITLQAATIAAMNIALYTFSILLYQGLSRRRQRLDNLGLEEFPHSIHPSVAAYLFPAVLLLFFFSIYGIVFFGFRVQLTALLEDALQGRSETRDMALTLLAGMLTGPIGVLLLLRLACTGVSWSHRSIRIHRFLHPARTIAWRDADRAVFHRSKGRDVVSAIDLHCGGKVVRIRSSWADPEKDWAPFVRDTAKILHAEKVPFQWDR